MSKKLYEESNISAIATKIREKTGGSTTYKTSEMPMGIDEVYDKGLIDGKKPEVIGDIDITKNGQFTYTPNEGQVFSSVEVNVNVEGSGGSDIHAWKLESPDVSFSNSWSIPFTTLGDVYGGSEFVRLETSLGDLNYVATDGTPYTYYSSSWGNVWGPPDYNIIVFTTALPDDLVDWLNRSGKQIV